MADISKLEQHANLLMGNIIGWENNTLARIGKRIKTIGKMSVSDLQALNNVADVRGDMASIMRDLAKVTNQNVAQIYKMYSEVLEEQHLANKPLYDYRKKTFVPFAENTELQAMAKAYAKSTAETMVNLAKTKALCIVEQSGKAIGLQKYYSAILDRAVVAVRSGSTDFHTAMRDAIIELGGSGARVDYGGGVTRRLDTAVRQNLLWGAKQASVAYNELIADDIGADGYEIDWHRNPRPSHVFMQGRQFCIGKTCEIRGRVFPGMDDTRDKTSGENVTESLEDYGCLHFQTPIICGVSEPRYNAEELKRLNAQNERKFMIGGKEITGYEAQQMQRKLETDIRKQNGIKQLAQASGDKVLVKECNAKIKAYRDKYTEISQAAGLAEELQRTTITRIRKS